MSTPNNPLPYERAAEGAPDRFVLTRDVTFRWARPPRWVRRLVGAQYFISSEGHLRMMADDAGEPYLMLVVYAGFHFSVSVAPDFARALAAACLHDWLYAHSRLIASRWDCSERQILHLADHWFLAQMRASGFLLARTYFLGVRIFGYAFRRLFGEDR